LKEEDAMMQLRKSWLALAVVALFLAPMAAFADIVGTDWTLLPTGTYSWAGGNNPLVGTNIGVQSVLGLGGLSNSGTSNPIQYGLLNFSSGPYLGWGWNWGSGSPNTLSIVGCIAGVTITTGTCTGANNVTLLSDDFQSVQIMPFGTGYNIAFGNVTGTINSAVAAYYGLSTTFATALFDTTMSTTSIFGQSFTGATNLGGTINAAGAVAGSVAASEDWGVFQSLGFFAVALVVFKVMIRLKLLRSDLL
jgi:hypothetical protein